MNIVIVFLEAINAPEAVEEGEKAGSVSVGYLDATAGAVINKLKMGKQVSTDKRHKGRRCIV